MATLVDEPDISAAWVAGLGHVLSVGGHASNLAVCIRNPLLERDSIRKLVEDFGDQMRGRRRGGPSRIDTVGETIFPSSFYRPSAAQPERHLYELERRTRRVIRRHHMNRHGTYFERLVAYPAQGGGEINQLEAVVRKLRRTAALGRRNGNAFELIIFHPERDTNLMGFPCLSYVSITLNDGRLDATAMYRNQYLLDRAYGNYVGLGRLMQFIAVESGFVVGELLCVASHARVEFGRYGKRNASGLFGACKSVLEESG